MTSDERQNGTDTLGSADRYRAMDRSEGMGRTGEGRAMDETDDERMANERDRYVAEERDRLTDTTGTGQTRADSPADDEADVRFGERDADNRTLQGDTGDNGISDNVGATGLEGRSAGGDDAPAP